MSCGIWAFPGTLAALLQTIPVGHLNVKVLVHGLILLLLGHDPRRAVGAIEFILALNDIDDLQAAELLVFPVRWFEGKGAAPEWAVFVDGAAIVFAQIVAAVPVLPHHEHTLALTKTGERLWFVVHIDVVAIRVTNKFLRIVARPSNDAADVVICEWQYRVLAAVAAAGAPELEILDGFWHGAWLNKSGPGVRAGCERGYERDASVLKTRECWEFDPLAVAGAVSVARVPGQASGLMDPEKRGRREAWRSVVT